MFYAGRFGLGNVYMHKGKYRMAEYHFRKASEINPTNATLLCCIGLVFERLGRLRDAFDKYTRAVALAPLSPAVRFKRVRMLLVFKQYEVRVLFRELNSPNTSCSTRPLTLL